MNHSGESNRRRTTSSFLNFLLSLIMHHILFSCFSNCDDHRDSKNEKANGKRAKKKVSWSSASKKDSDVLLPKYKHVLSRCHSGLCPFSVDDQEKHNKPLKKKHSLELMDDGVSSLDLPYIDADDQDYFLFNKNRRSRNIEVGNLNASYPKRTIIQDSVEKRVTLADAEQFGSTRGSKSGTPASNKSLKSTSSVKSADFLEVIDALQKNEIELEEVRKNFRLKFVDDTKTATMDSPFLIVENGQKSRANTLIGMKNQKEGVLITTTVTESPNRVVTEVAKKFSDSWKEYELVSVRRTKSSNGVLDDQDNEDVRITKLPLSDDMEDSLHIISEKSPDSDILETTALAICNRKNSSMAVEFLTNLSHMLVDDCTAFHTAENSRNQTPVVEFKDFVLPVDISELTNQKPQCRIPKYSSSRNNPTVPGFLPKDQDGFWELDCKAADQQQLLELDKLLKDLNDKRSKEAANFAKEFFASSKISDRRIKEPSFPIE